MNARDALNIIAKERPCPHDAWEAGQGSARCADCSSNFTPNQRDAARKEAEKFDWAMGIITKLVESCTMTAPDTTPPQVPAVLCGIFIGANIVADDAKNTIGRIVNADKERALVFYVDRPAATRPIQWLHILLDSPLALCHAARWLAQRRGHPPVATAPEWSLEESGGKLCWQLRSGYDSALFPAIDIGLSDAEALAAACVAVGGAS